MLLFRLYTLGRGFRTFDEYMPSYSFALGLTRDYDVDSQALHRKPKIARTNLSVVPLRTTSFPIGVVQETAFSGGGNACGSIYMLGISVYNVSFKYESSSLSFILQETLHGCLKHISNAFQPRPSFARPSRFLFELQSLV